MAIDVKIAYSEELISDNAIDEVARNIDLSEDALKFVFFSSNYSINRIQDSLNKHFDNNLMACSTAGEIHPKGFSKNSVVAASIKSDAIKFKKYEINDLVSFNIFNVYEIFADFEKEFGYAPSQADKFVGILLIDGMSLLEDKVIALISRVFSPIKIVGGSAGDDLHFAHTYVYNGGELRSNAASFILLRSEVPFRVFKTQFFEQCSDRIIITEANPRQRIVYEINGEKAAIEYANLLNIPLEELNPYIFAKHPLLLSIGGKWYVRSIKEMNNDYSLSFFSAIDVGLVMHIARPTDILSDYKNLISELKNDLNDISLILSFDCIHRRFLIEKEGHIENVNDIIVNYPFCGFNTYGEQYAGVHINQSLTGIAFGK